MHDGVTGTQCPACGGRLAATGGDEYRCDACGNLAEVTDMYLP